MQRDDPDEGEAVAAGEPSEPKVYLLRVWRGQAAPGGASWRGKIQNILSPRAAYFEGWSELVGVLEAIWPDVAETAPQDRRQAWPEDGEILS